MFQFLLYFTDSVPLYTLATHRALNFKAGSDVAERSCRSYDECGKWRCVKWIRTPEEEPGGFTQSYFLIHLCTTSLVGSGCREVHLVRFPLTARENSLVVVHPGRATDTRPLLGFTASSQVLKVLFQCHVQSVSMKA